MATRHLCRSILLQSLYEWDFNRANLKRDIDLMAIIDRNMKDALSFIDEPDFVYRLAKNLVDHFAEIDNIIQKTAPEWPLDQINLIDRNILRLGLSELIFGPKDEVPPKVAINEAVELAKTFGSESSSKFVNGVLGTIYRQLVEEGVIKESAPKSKKEVSQNSAEEEENETTMQNEKNIEGDSLLEQK